jgi:drug/metabolite transporter (DMT)-like permease
MGYIHSHLVRAALFIIVAEFLFASMAVAIRHISEIASNEQVVFFRNLFGILILTPWLLRHRTEGLRSAVPHLHLLRSVAGLGAMYCFFYAIAHLPLAQAMLLKLSAPLFIPIIALFWLKEPVGTGVGLALLLGFVGVILVLRPEAQGLDPVALIALAGGALAAVAKTTVRRLGRTEPVGRIVFYFALVGTAISALPLFWAWQPLGLHNYAWLLAVAALATAGQVFLTKGFGLAPAARMGAFGYSSVLFGALYGWWLWAETPTALMIGGAALIALAGILATHEKSKTNIQVESNSAAVPEPLEEADIAPVAIKHSPSQSR